MSEDTEISTPVGNEVQDTSSNVKPEETEIKSDTLTEEPEIGDNTAETETEPTLYAGKYKSVEELEKGYKEVEKSIAKASEFEKKYNELLQKQEQQQALYQAEALENAKRRGYDSIESQQINDFLNEAEFNEYYNYSSALNAENAGQVQQLLQQGYLLLQQGYTNEAIQFLNEAKRYYPSNFIEEVALAKKQKYSQFAEQVNQKAYKAQDEQTKNLANTIKNDYADFLTDLNENEGKAEALKAFCNTGHIANKQDFEVFKTIYEKIVNTAKETAIKEYEAQKQIEATKDASQINTNQNSVIDGRMPTYREFMALSREDYEKAVEKYGLQAIINAK